MGQWQAGNRTNLQNDAYDLAAAALEGVVHEPFYKYVNEQVRAVDGKRILRQSSVDLMMTPIGLRNINGWAQGLGLAGPKDIRGRQVWGHDGEDRGAANAFDINRETGVGAIALANAMDPDFTMT